jgi:hypothetical protein
MGVSIMAITAALFATLFYLSGFVSLPKFTLLYLPIILLGVFPVWFGLSGLAGCMIGGIIGGFFVEGLGYLAWIEAVTALIIYGLNWVLIPRKVMEEKTKRNLVLLFVVYALTLFAGTCFILWQFTIFGLLPLEVAEAFLLPTFALNLVIECVVCPVLIKELSPKLRSMGWYAGTLTEWRSRRTNP